MTARPGARTGQPPPAGLCAACRNHRVLDTARGSRFILCGLSRTDHRFPRYPALPVLSCAGFEPIRTGPDDRYL